jgi:beta-mannosidase
MFKQGDRSSTNSYLPANNVPTEVHRDLLKNDKISDPFEDLNELSVRWVADQTWTYRTTFAAPKNHGKANVVINLRFEGLDTFASIYLNGNLILESDNMFVEHRVNVSEKLNSEENLWNVLEIEFDSARKKGLELVEQHKDHRFIVHQTEISRGPVRKAQYHWGWDWGPVLMSCGPWKPISLETYACRLSNLQIRYQLAADLRSAEVQVSVEWEGTLVGVAFHVNDETCDRSVYDEFMNVESHGESGIVETTFTVGCGFNIELWWPRGYGDQALYRVEASAHNCEEEEWDPGPEGHCVSNTIGFRKAELVQEPDTRGQSFYFRINNVDVFCGGSNWIPADSFLTRLTDKDYRDWVQMAADGNQTMLRIWGGGIYEADALYDAADELGILIWQDFMFACANYPAYPEYLNSVETETRQNVRRLKDHPSIVLWAGNNEDYQMVERYGLDYNPDDKDPSSWLKTNFPARYIYEHLLPKTIEEESPNVSYHPSSPFGNGKSTVLKVDPSIGDIHQWNVWHGTMEPYQRLAEMGGRFISEFGMEAYPHIATIEQCITRAEDRYPGSMAMDFHNKAIGHERRLITYIAENFRIRYDLEGFTHLTQVMQADAMACAYKSWRRQWGSPGRRQCGGALVWQLNDCWPTMSWAVVDYHRVPKPAYYAIKRAMSPMAIGVQRKYKSWTTRSADNLWQRDTSHIDMRHVSQDTEFDVWVANGTRTDVQCEVRIEYISIKTGEVVGTKVPQHMFVAPNSTTIVLENHTVHLGEAQKPDEPFETAKTDPFVIHVSLYMQDECISRDTAWPEPIKYLSFAERGVGVRYSKDGTKVFVTARKPIKGFVFSERKGVQLSDNGFDVLPGELKEVEVKGCAANELKWRYVEM